MRLRQLTLEIAILAHVVGWAATVAAAANLAASDCTGIRLPPDGFRQDKYGSAARIV
jgi:hypothetical protein